MQDSTTEKAISARALDRLLAAHDGDVALLYLYWLRNDSQDLEQAAAALCRTMREIGAAEEKLRRMGLLPSVGASAQPVSEKAYASEVVREVLSPSEELPQYTAEDIARRSREDPAFSAILAETARVVGRNLSSNDMRVLFGVYDSLGLPAEVVFMLLSYCAEQYSERYGSSRRPSARAIEKLAYQWAREEIMTLEQAEAYITAQKERRGEIGRIRTLLNIYGRELTATEEKYITSWLVMGFHEDAVAIAYDRTLTQTGALKWPYMNKILLSWHEKGLHTAGEIEEKDSRRPVRTRPGGREQSPVTVTIKDLDDILSKM
ncbi:MAG: DnaD domain protein [Oscillospiraceae bacterium]|nr:DnaD domain protein [Oscillospiraceae bacterium]